MNAPEQLSPDECHLWITKSATTLPPKAVEAYERLLTDDEAARYRRFLFERHRHLYLLTRALVRTTLSRYHPIPPTRWRFREGEWGKPEISEPELDRSLHFNLSNAEGMVVCLVARDCAVGVDVENCERLDQPTAIAERFFSPREVIDLLALPEEQQRERFFAYWTLKEAYIKARGMGLALPLNQFSFVLAPGSDQIEIEFDERLQDDPVAWQFGRVRVDEPHALAFAIQRETRPSLTLRVREFVPEF